jgi:dUTP pyrophosphatase
MYNFSETNEEPKLLFKRMRPNAKVPVRATNHAAAYDLFAAETGTIGKSSRLLIGSGVAMRLPALPAPFRAYGSIRSRSGLAVKNSVDIAAGVIDIDFIDEIKVLLVNNSDVPYTVVKGARIAQLIIEVHVAPEIAIVDDLPPLANNNRSGGFGSTGLNELEAKNERLSKPCQIDLIRDCIVRNDFEPIKDWSVGRLTEARDIASKYAGRTDQVTKLQKMIDDKLKLSPD